MKFLCCFASALSPRIVLLTKRLPDIKSNVSNIPDFDLVNASLLVLIDIDVDGKMRVYVAHLVFVTLRDTGDHVLDDRANSSKAGDGFACTVMHFNADCVAPALLEGDSEMLQVLDEFAC